MINITFVLRSSKRRCYDNQLIWSTTSESYRLISPPFFPLAFHDELEYRYVDCASTAAMFSLYRVEIWWLPFNELGDYETHLCTSGVDQYLC